MLMVIRQPWDEIREMPTVVGEIRDGLGRFPHPDIRVHESCLRAWGILAEIKRLLDNGTPGPVVQEVIAFLESAGPSGPKYSEERVARDEAGRQA